MGDERGFLKVKRKGLAYRPVCERIKDFSEVAILPTAAHSQEQASRCMDCGVPFCHWGCPVANYIPEWNDLVFHKEWEKAFNLLSATNCLPEVTGRICPAPCETACILGVNDDPVTTRENELAIAEYAFRNGLVAPRIIKKRTGSKVAVIGSGPSGLSCADALNLAGHNVVVFEKDDAIGGILRYGIPDFKLEKKILERRIKIWEKEGIKFKTSVDVGVDITIDDLRDKFDAVCLAAGTRTPRDLKVPGRDLSGVYFAMEYLTQANKRVAGKKIPANQLIDAKNKRVVVIGGGDTGADCMGLAHRQGASCVVQIEIMPRPAAPKISTSHQEGGERQWSILTKEFAGKHGHVQKLICARVEFCPQIKEISGSDFEIEADLVVLALGFLRPEIKTDANFMTPDTGVFCCGDMRRGQSLVVWAIAEGRQAASNISRYLGD